MSIVKIPVEFMKFLENQKSPALLCDPDGRIVGQFLPQPENYVHKPLNPELSPEELAQRKKTGKWYTTAEVLEKFKDL